MKFTQIIEFHTDRVDELRALVQEYEDQVRMEDRPDKPRHRTLLQDRDNPRRFLAVVQFESYESAMANSAHQETTALSQKLATLTLEPPAFTNCDVLEDKDI